MRNTIAAALAVALMTMAAASAQQKPTHAARRQAGAGQRQAAGGLEGPLRQARRQARDGGGRRGEQGALTFKTGPGRDLLQARHEGRGGLRGQRLVLAARTGRASRRNSGSSSPARISTRTPSTTRRFLVRQDARFAIQKRTGAATKYAVAWRPVPAMKEPKGVKTTNTLIIRAAGQQRPLLHRRQGSGQADARPGRRRRHRRPAHQSQPAPPGQQVRGQELQ